jgi:hypothetical protein
MFLPASQPASPKQWNAYGISRRHKLWSIAALTFWIVFAALLVEEARSLVHITIWPTADWKVACERGHGIRVVSLNCAMANSRAAAEVTKWKPDIVLFQESPIREHLDR